MLNRRPKITTRPSVFSEIWKPDSIPANDVRAFHAKPTDCIHYASKGKREFDIKRFNDAVKGD